MSELALGLVFPETETTLGRPRMLPAHRRSRLDFRITDAEQDLAEAFIHGLTRLHEDDAISAKVARIAAKLLRDVRRRIVGLDVPTIVPGPDGLVGMTWDDGLRHVNIHVLSNGGVEFYAQGFTPNASWSEEHGAAVVNEQLLNHLRQMADALSNEAWP